MDIRIGIIQSMRELELELADDVKRDDLKKEIATILASDDGILWLTDRKGREVGVPASKISYVELGKASDSRNIGFSA